VLSLGPGAAPSLALSVPCSVRLGDHPLESPVPRDGSYGHGSIDDNDDAHLRAVLFGESVTEGALAWGTWQSVLLVDCDEPRTRRLCRRNRPTPPVQYPESLGEVFGGFGPGGPDRWSTTAGTRLNDRH